MLRFLSVLLYIANLQTASSFRTGASRRNAVTMPQSNLIIRGGCNAPTTTQLQATATTFNAVGSNKSKNPLVLLFSTIRMFFFSLLRMFTGKMIQRTDSELKQGIAHFYDESSQIWLDVWGEHMHHGKKYPCDDLAEGTLYPFYHSLLTHLIRCFQCYPTRTYVSGYYPSATYSDHHQAQIDMIDRTLNWAYHNDNTPVCHQWQY